MASFFLVERLAAALAPVCLSLGQADISFSCVALSLLLTTQVQCPKKQARCLIDLLVALGGFNRGIANLSRQEKRGKSLRVT
jgi:hypothetical protein